MSEQALRSAEAAVDDADTAAAAPVQPVSQRLRLDWTHLSSGGRPGDIGRVSQSLSGGRERPVTVERKRRPQIRG